MNDSPPQFTIDLSNFANAVEIDGIRYRRLNPRTDPPVVCQLFETVFHHAMMPSYWQWKYLQGPDSGSFAIVLEHMATGRMIGHMGVLVLPGMRTGNALRMGQVCDVMLHPEYRAGIGPHSIYLRMNQALRQLAHGSQLSEQAPLYMYGFPGLRPANLGERIGVYRRLQICTEYVTPNSSDANALQQLWYRCNPWRLRVQMLRDTSTEQSDALLDEIWLQHSRAIREHEELHQTPHIVKNAAYLRWRYLMHPHQCQAGESVMPLYVLWLLQKGGNPVGWLVTRTQPRPTVVDSCLPPGPGWATAALRALPAPNPEQAGWSSWLVQSGAEAVPTPIHAVEVLGQPFHFDWPSPNFQPGDTDVF